jgi:AraC family transcriptional regulator
MVAVERYVEVHLDEPLDPPRLAKEAALSLHHFHRIFRAQRGESVMQLVRRLRLERSARALRASRDPVTTIAFAAGYGSHEAFTRAFVERFGVSPSAYRAEPSIRVREHLAKAPERPTLPVTIRELPELRVAYLRHHGSYARVGATWERLRAHLARLRIEGALYGSCPDDPEVTPEPMLRFSACVEVASSFVPDGDLTLGTIPGGIYASAVHTGPFEALSETYLELIGRWLPRSGRVATTDPVVEHYLDDPRTTAPSELRTEVRIRLED